METIAAQPSTKPADILRSVYSDRRQRNQRYSMRSFARDLGISQSLLSLVLSGKRPLTVKQAVRMSAILGFTQSEADQFVELTLQQGSPSKNSTAPPIRWPFAKSNFVDQDAENFKAISRWHHTAILDLVTTAGFKADISWISRRLSITPAEAEDALQRLVLLGLLVQSEGTYKKANAKIYFKSKTSTLAVRNFHKQMIQKALDQLESDSDESFHSREISAITLAVPKRRTEEARRRIQQFQREFAETFTDGECDEVYQLNVQLFPLTRAVKAEETRQ